MKPGSREQYVGWWIDSDCFDAVGEAKFDTEDESLNIIDFESIIRTKKSGTGGPNTSS